MKRIKYFAILLLSACLLCGCDEGEMQQDNMYTLYQLDRENMQMTDSEYEVEEGSGTVDIISGMLEKYENLDIRDFTIKENQLSLFLSSNYLNNTRLEEVILRASIVKTLCQVEGIDYVEFFVENKSLELDGEQVGVMNELSFLDSVGGDGYTQEKIVTLYFANAQGKLLREVSAKLSYDLTVPLAKLLIEQLIAGPEELVGVNTSDIQQTIPEETVLNSLTIRDHVCYVDLSNQFVNIQENLNSEIVVYSIVNTLCELSEVNKVQFTIDGEPRSEFGDVKDFNKPFERNLNLTTGVSEG